MKSESTVHWGDYGCANPKERQFREYRGNRTGKVWHQALKPYEITDLFVIWGIVGKRRPINPVVRLMPYFDRGPWIITGHDGQDR